CVAAKTSPESRASQSISMLLVEKGTPGLRVSRALDKTGWRSSDTAELAFEDCRIPADHLLGREGSGFYAIMHNFQNERLVLGAMAMGEAQEALELTLDYVTARKAFGATLYEKQAVRQRLAMLAAQVEAGRQLVYHAAWLDTQDIDCTREPALARELAMLRAGASGNRLMLLPPGSGYDAQNRRPRIAGSPTRGRKR